MDFYSKMSDWSAVAKLSAETLAIDPDDPAGKRSQVIASASIDQIRQAEANVRTSPTVDDFLKLSVLYFHNRRYDDCVTAARNAVRLRPDLAEGYANIAAALHTMGRDE